MEQIEFYNINGVTWINRNGQSRILTSKDRDCVGFMMENIKKYFPEAMNALMSWASDSRRNVPYYEFRIVDRFIRCNFGEADFLSPDIEMGRFHFEEVKCPLRGICKGEGVICKPRPLTDMPEEEKKVVGLYSKGLLPHEIAMELGKKESTVKRQIHNAYTRLKLPHPRWLIRLFNSYTF